MKKEASISIALLFGGYRFTLLTRSDSLSVLVSVTVFVVNISRFFRIDLINRLFIILVYFIIVRLDRVRCRGNPEKTPANLNAAY
ncbi:MAG: hypothetical protein K2G69_08320 [Muribaculaceae bacterium]|nr:hypothetical protein [Muribaculaceae bacterium]